MKTILKSVIMLLFLSVVLFAQEKEELDVQPFPVGGIMEIAKHVEYPAEAKENNIEGKVFVEAVISKEGEVESTKVVKSVGYGCDEAAEKAIKAVKFTPGEKDGKKVKATVVIPVMFKLK